MSDLKIPFSGLRKQYNDLRDEILAATDEVLRSGQLMNGNFTAEFENWLAKRNHVKYAICVHSGTQALECLAEYYLKKELYDHPLAIMPSFTYMATANAFMRAGWDVHFIDTDSQGLLDMRKIPNDLEFSAIVLVGLYGASITHLGDVKVWQKLTLGSKIIIEDAAQHWLAADSVRIGNAAAISFDPMKNLPCYGNGGAIVTNDSDLLHFARSWRDNGKTDHRNTGTNSRMSELDSAHMIIKTRYLDQWQDRRAKISQYWRDKFRGSAVRCLINRDNYHDHCHHKFVIDLDDRDSLQKKLTQRNIETRIHYIQPLHEIGLFRQFPGPDILSSASALSRRVLSLPIYPELTDLAVEYIADQVLDSVNNSG
jgi:dTDP-4-amino-4,6-dideoxygalactose transaminase